jgi:hypothetical protein
MMTFQEQENEAINLSANVALGRVERRYGEALGGNGFGIYEAAQSSLGTVDAMDEDGETVEVFKAGMAVGSAPVF